jgi:hypothetical protein
MYPPPKKTNYGTEEYLIVKNILSNLNLKMG